MMNKKCNQAFNLLLLLMSLILCFILLEIACRVIHWAECDDFQINNPYYYIERIGEVQPFTPFAGYQEKVPLQFDHQAYYTPTNGIIRFYSNQFGARWIAPDEQPLGAINILILGDSFTYGHGLHYQDAFIYKLQQKLAKDSCNHISLLNFAKRGADCEEIFSIYQQFRDRVPHDAVFYCLHINDLVGFTTSYIITNPLAIPWLVQKSKGCDFIAKRIHKFLIKKYRIRQLTNPALFEETFFITKFKALVQLQNAVNNKGIPFYVILLPILVDLKKGTLKPLYDGIKKHLEAAKIEYMDLTPCLGNFDDRDVWILPFDQHPNAKANLIFANKLFDGFHKGRIVKKSANKNRR